MSRAHTSSGKRRSGMTHATRGHHCDFCDNVSFGNGGKVAHARSHVRAGEAVELVRFWAHMPSPSRVFLPVADTDRIERFLSDGYLRGGRECPAV